MKTLDSLAYLKIHWLCWKVLGVVRENVKFKICYLFYGILLNTLVTLCYPMHLALALFGNETQAENFQNLAVCVTCIACSTKFIIYSMQLKKVRELEEILCVLDARVTTREELNYAKQMDGNIRNILYLFVSVYFPIGVTAELSFVFRQERSLLYPAWFPFDWHDSVLNFYLAHVYQIVGISFHLLQNFVDDTFPTITLCLLSGHIKLLGLRASKIGHNNNDLVQNEAALQHCIVDQQNLYKLFDLIQEIITLPMLIQFTVTATNICVAMAALLFYVDTVLDRMYYFVYFIAMPLQIFPTCYYGSHFRLLFEELHRNVFYSNWVQQSRTFKKNMILFIERSLKVSTAMAGHLIPINLSTFISTCKGAYSLFALIMNFRN